MRACTRRDPVLSPASSQKHSVIRWWATGDAAPSFRLLYQIWRMVVFKPFWEPPVPVAEFSLPPPAAVALPVGVPSLLYLAGAEQILRPFNAAKQLVQQFLGKSLSSCSFSLEAWGQISHTQKDGHSLYLSAIFENGYFRVKTHYIIVSVRCAPPNGADFDGLVSTIDSGHLGALYGCEAEEAALAG